MEESVIAVNFSKTRIFHSSPYMLLVVISGLDRGWCGNQHTFSWWMDSK